MKITPTSVINSSTTNCFSKIVDGFHKFFGIYSFDKDKRRNATILLSALILMSILALIQISAAIAFNMSQAMYRLLLNIPFIVATFVCLGCVIIFKFTQAFQLTGNFSLIFGIAVL